METPPPPPPSPVAQSFLRRNKYVLPLLLTVNVSAGAYLLLKPKEKAMDTEKPTTAMSQTASTTSPQTESKPLPTPTISEPVKPSDPFSEDQQRELFKWILEEKRKIKPKDGEKKKRIDEEKAILKQFIRASSVPAI